MTFEDRSWSASLADVGCVIDYDAMVDLAMAHGRADGFLDRHETFLYRNGASQVPIVLIENEEALTSYLQAVAQEVNVDPTDARLTMENGELTIEPEIDGRKLDVASSAQTALQLLRTGTWAEFELPVSPILAKVKQADLTGAEEDAWKLVSAPITFTHNGLSFPISTEHLTQALQIDSLNQASIDPTILHDRIQQISQETRESPTNVLLGWDGGPVVVQADVDGWEVDVPAIEDLATVLVQSDDRIAPLPMKPVKAAARADNVAELGLESPLGYGSSSFIGSSAARAENVRVSARNISYKLVEPGGTFSFNDLLGPITEDAGYVSGTIIQDNWVESDIGGGVCQVSTTVFRAAAQSGFRFNEWNPHSWRLAFYEADGSDPGLDAAIYQADPSGDWSLDLVFENPLDSWLLLVVTTEGETVTAQYFGKNPGWNVELHPAQVSEPIEPGPAQERENPDLAPGERKLVQSAQPGYVVSVRRVISSADGEIIADGNFVSDYIPQPEAWEVGPN